MLVLWFFCLLLIGMFIVNRSFFKVLLVFEIGVLGGLFLALSFSISGFFLCFFVFLMSSVLGFVLLLVVLKNVSSSYSYSWCF